MGRLSAGQQAGLPTDGPIRPCNTAKDSSCHPELLSKEMPTSVSPARSRILVRTWRAFLAPRSAVIKTLESRISPMRAGSAAHHEPQRQPRRLRQSPGRWLQLSLPEAARCTRRSCGARVPPAGEPPPAAINIVWPAPKSATPATLILVAPAADAFWRVVGCKRKSAQWLWVSGPAKGVFEIEATGSAKPNSTGLQNRKCRSTTLRQTVKMKCMEKRLHVI